jgi:hypothetical protein
MMPVLITKPEAIGKPDCEERNVPKDFPFGWMLNFTLKIETPYPASVRTSESPNVFCKESIVFTEI